MIIVLVLIAAVASVGILLLIKQALRLKKVLAQTKDWSQTAVELQRETLTRLKNYDRTARQRDVWLYRQIESLIELNSLLDFSLTGLRSWAISPDAAVLLYKLLLELKPKTVLELGSGASSAIIARALKVNGQGHLISIDHNAQYAEKTKQLLERHKLLQFCDVRVAKLRPIKRQNQRWYDLNEATRGIKQIDFLLVDGPPAATGPMARQPAVPLLKDILSKQVVIFMDDFRRQDEQAAAASWSELLPNHKIEVFETEKGTAIIKPKTE